MVVIIYAFSQNISFDFSWFTEVHIVHLRRIHWFQIWLLPFYTPYRVCDVFMNKEVKKLILKEFENLTTLELARSSVPYVSRFMKLYCTSHISKFGLIFHKGHFKLCFNKAKASTSSGNLNNLKPSVLEFVQVLKQVCLVESKSSAITEYIVDFKFFLYKSKPTWCHPCWCDKSD